MPRQQPTQIDEKSLWVRFAVAAIESYERPSTVDDPEERADDVAQQAAWVADNMLETFAERFGLRLKSIRPARSSARDRDEEEDE